MCGKDLYKEKFKTAWRKSVMRLHKDTVCTDTKQKTAGNINGESSHTVCDAEVTSTNLVHFYTWIWWDNDRPIKGQMVSCLNSVVVINPPWLWKIQVFLFENFYCHYTERGNFELWVLYVVFSFFSAQMFTKACTFAFSFAVSLCNLTIDLICQNFFMHLCPQVQIFYTNTNLIFYLIS